MTDNKRNRRCENILYAGPKSARNILIHLSPNQTQKPGPSYNFVHSHQKYFRSILWSSYSVLQFRILPQSHIKNVHDDEEHTDIWLLREFARRNQIENL